MTALSLGMTRTYAEPRNLVTASGYTETSEGRQLLEDAVASANFILTSSSAYRVRTSWKNSTEEADGTKIVRVYLVEPTTPNFVIQVPFRSCNCIFLQIPAFRQNLTRYSTKLKRMMKIEERDMLAFMILHEIGHIVHGDPGQFDEETGSYNVDDTLQKQKESAADEFAAQRLMLAMDSKSSPPGFVSSLSVQLALSNASWNLMALRLLDGFGGSALCSKYLFLDKGASHPNYELRILSVNNIITKSAISHELLEAFEACRKPRTDEPVYKQ